MIARKFIAKGTAASLSFGLGFKPDYVKILNGDTRTELVWNRGSVSQQRFGQTADVDGTKADAASAAAGIVLYDGEGPLTADSTTKLKNDRTDKKGDITNFTIDTPANKTGHFNAGVDTDVVGVGSKVVFSHDGQEGLTAVIVALTNDGDAADEVTLDVLPKAHLSGMASEVGKIYGMFDFVGASLGEAIPPGFTLGASATVNQDGDYLEIEAGCYDYE